MDPERSDNPGGAPGPPDRLDLKRRASDRVWEGSYWECPVTRRNLIIGFLLTSTMFAAVLAYTLSVQSTVRTNQCHVLNRLSETKLLLRDLLDKSPPRTFAQGQEFKRARIQLSEGLVVLERDVLRLKNCRLFDNLRQRDRTGEPPQFDRRGPVR